MTLTWALRMPCSRISSRALSQDQRGRVHQSLVGTGVPVERHRRHGQALVTGLVAVSRPAVVADNPEHGLPVLLVAREGAHLAGHFGRGGVRGAGHEGGNGAAQGAALVGVVGDGRGHQVAPDVGESEPQGAELVRQLGDAGRRELGHQHGDFQGQGPQAHRVFEVLHPEGAVLAQEGGQVEGRQVARRVVQEHVLRARVGGVDAAAFGAGMPIVDGGVELQAGIGRGPGGIADLLPQVAGLDALFDAAVGAPHQFPFAAFQHLLQKVVRQAHGVVGVLARHGEVGFLVPIGVEFREGHLGIALAGELHDALDVAFGNHGLARGTDGGLQGRV